MNFKRFLACTLSISVILSTASFNLKAFAAPDPAGKKPYKIHLKNGTIEPKSSSPMKNKSAGKDFSGEEKKSQPYIIAFTGPVTEEMKDGVTKAGASLDSYLPDFAFLSLIAPDAADTVKKLDFVADVIPYDSQYKIDPGLLSKIEGKDAEGLDDEVKINISTFDTDLTGLDSEIAKKGFEKLHSEKTSFTLKARLNSVSDLAKLDEVKYIEEAPELKLDNDIARGIIGLESVSNSVYNGENQIIGIGDTGLDTGYPGLLNNTLHPDFSGRVNNIIDEIGGTSGIDKHGHGTHTSGSIIGSGQMSNGKIKGTAPGAHLIMQTIANAQGQVYLPSSLYSLLQEAYNYGARIHSDSWGADEGGTYTANCNSLDQFMWDHPDMTVLFSAGNTGRNGYSTVGAPGSAKNCITVGASENFRPYMPLESYSSNTDNPAQRAVFSSYGCADGRIKPDVVAPGSEIASTQSSRAPSNEPYPGNSYYQFMSGTSMSTPVTAGVTAVIRQYIQNNFNISNPSAALIKAFIINGALSQGYTQEQGFGKISVYDSLGSTKIVDSNSSVQTGQTREYTSSCTVSRTDKPLKLSLVWTDYPASTTAAASLVNDLDLKVTAPDGTVYNGNDLTSPFNSEADRTNNVETVAIPAPQQGTYSIEVTGYNVPYGPQPFALVYSSDFFSVPRNLTASSTTSSITVNWDAVPGASSYDLEIDGTTTLSLTGTSYTQSNLAYNSSHTYKVRAKSPAETGEWSNTITASALLYSPSVSGSASNSRLTISWEPVSGTTGYDVYIEGAFAGYTTNTTYSLALTQPASTYHFSVRARTDFNTSESTDIALTTLDSGISYKAPMLEARMDFASAAAQNGKIYVFGGKKGPFYINTVEEYDQATDTWSSKTPLSASKIGMGAVQAGNEKIYVIGGYDGANYLNTVEEYDTSNNTWAVKADMPTARSNLGVVYTDGKIYAIGGTDGSPLSTVEIYDPVLDTWTSGSSMPTARSEFGISLSDGKIEVMGGVNGSNNLKALEEYDPVQDVWSIRKNLNDWNTDFAVSELNGKLYSSGGKNSDRIGEYDGSSGLWTLRSRLPSSIYGHSSVALGDKLYIIGGFDDTNHSYLNTLIEYEPQCGEWEKQGDMNYPKSRFASASLNNKIYTFGGWGGNNLGLNALNKVEEFDPPTGSWSECADMPMPKVSAAAAALNGKIYVSGGANQHAALASEYYDSMDEYDPVTRTWSPKAPIPEIRYGHEMVACNGYLYVIGGDRAVYNSATHEYLTTLSTNVYRYDPSNDTWSTMAPLPSARYGHGVAVANGKIYVIGGFGYGGVTDYVDSIEEYNPATNTWTTKNPIPEGQRYFGIVSINDKIYIIGGSSNIVKEYDPVSQSWTDKGYYAFNSAIIHRAEFADNKIYVMGGYSYIDLPLCMRDVYESDSFFTTLTAGSTVMEPKAGSKTIPVSISNVPGEGIYEAQVVLYYDPSQLSVANAAPGDAIPDGYGFTYTADNTQGEITLTFTGDMNTQRLITSDGTFANIEFDVPDSTGIPGSTGLSLDRSGCRLYKNPGYEYEGIKLNNGSVDIFMYGDVNGSSTVTTDDFNMVYDYIMQNISCFPSNYGSLSADVNGDGSVNSLDLSAIGQYLQGLITKFPVQQ